MRRLFAEGAFNQAFVPVLSEYRSTKSLADVQLLINSVAGSLGGFLLIFTFVAVVAAPLIAVPIAYGFTDEPDKFALLVEMLRITFPYLFLISMTALCGSILNSYARFAVPAVTPALLNLSLIICSFFFSAVYARAGIGAGMGGANSGSCTTLVSIAFFGSHATNACAYCGGNITRVLSVLRS